METVLVVAVGIAAGAALIAGVGAVVMLINDRYDGDPSPQQAYDGYWEGY